MFEIICFPNDSELCINNHYMNEYKMQSHATIRYFAVIYTKNRDKHRVCIVPGFLSNRPELGPPPPHLQESVPNSDDGIDILVFRYIHTVL